jgi:hypothetical protein
VSVAFLFSWLLLNRWNAEVTLTVTVIATMGALLPALLFPPLYDVFN